jgi:hypothetical protein
MAEAESRIQRKAQLLEFHKPAYCGSLAHQSQSNVVKGSLRSWRQMLVHLCCVIL